MLRFINNCKTFMPKLSGPLQVDELKNAHNCLIKLAQKDSFSKELNLIKNGKSLKPTLLISLDPFLDVDGIIRVGGRLSSSMYSFDKKHPIVLKGDHELTKLLFRQEHYRLLHAGPQLLLASMRERYWPIGGRNVARRTSRECVVCRRIKGTTLTNIMGNLPVERVHPNYPFCTTGTDFAGPFYIADRKGRGAKIVKCYLCIFVCFCFKCVHLEAVSDLTMDAFILTLKRFIARRGKPNIIFCDNGRNFVAASKEINMFLKSKSNATGLVDFAAREGIEFRMSPAYAPNFGGLFEAGVKSAKFHLNRVLKNTHLTFEELLSLFAQVEAILNSRPLCPLSPSPNDFCTLTPGHFLIGRPLTSFPSPCLEDRTTNLDRYQRIEQARQHFWRRWTTEYVGELQQRTKWKVRCKDLCLNDLVVIKDDVAPPLCWRLGRIAKLYPGPDGVPRVADIATSRGTVKRAINKICVLSNSDNT
nr:uncharacterized protein LOC128676157 [Plodia interpunctella]